MADWPVKALGGKTLLQAAATPYMDKLARMGVAAACSKVLPPRAFTGQSAIPLSLIHI